MTRILKTLLIAAVLAGAFVVPTALADKPDGKVEWRDGGEKKNVVIRKGNKTYIIRTSPEAAERIQRMVQDGDRVVIRDRGRFTYYPENYYPYYRDKGAAYSVGRALGSKID